MSDADSKTLLTVDGHGRKAKEDALGRIIQRTAENNYKLGYDNGYKYGRAQASPWRRLRRWLGL
jgi:hypothetical protein